MITTGRHEILYIGILLFAVSMVFYFCRARKTAFYILISGLLVYTLYLLGRGWVGGVFLINPIVEAPFLLPWCIGMIALVKGILNREGDWGILLIGTVMASVFAMFYAKGIIPPTPNKLTVWVPLFFVPEVMGHALFFCGALYAVASGFGKNKDMDFHNLIIWGFVFYSISQVTGAVWCYLGWGNTFRWSTRHMASAAIWTLYAAYIHLRFLPGFTRRGKAWFALAGGLIVLYIGFSGYLHELRFPRIGG
ncbi:MAG: cytochrome c biogenesis protein [Desulfobacterales bacterium]|nr:cytochrome c biogenesis protein [Desulfobacterales bacterium]